MNDTIKLLFAGGAIAMLFVAFVGYAVSGNTSGAFTALFVLFCVAVYIFPLLLASHRDCKALAGIVIVNLFLGWTFVGWVVVLAWAAIGEKNPPKPSPTA